MPDDPRISFARELRQRQTRAEAKLWQALRGGRLDRQKWRRQAPVGPYYADFACEALRLIVELDGGVHDTDAQMDRDFLRQQALEGLGWFVLRFKNEDVLHDLYSTLEVIRQHARLAGGATPHPPTR